MLPAQFTPRWPSAIISESRQEVSGEPQAVFLTAPPQIRGELEFNKPFSQQEALARALLNSAYLLENLFLLEFLSSISRGKQHKHISGNEKSPRVQTEREKTRRVSRLVYGAIGQWAKPSGWALQSEGGLSSQGWTLQSGPRESSLSLRDRTATHASHYNESHFNPQGGKRGPSLGFQRCQGL